MVGECFELCAPDPAGDASSGSGGAAAEVAMRGGGGAHVQQQHCMKVVLKVREGRQLKPGDEIEVLVPFAFANPAAPARRPPRALTTCFDGGVELR